MFGAKAWLYTALLFLSTSVQAYSGYLGNDLRSDLTAAEPLTNGVKVDVDGLLADARATSYIEGVSTMLSADLVVCFAPHVTFGQTNAIVLKYLRENPEIWNSNAAVAVIRALKQAFPCNSSAPNATK
jgi:hypothetical protein